MRWLRRCGSGECRAAVVRFGGSSIDATSASKKTLYAAEQKRAEVARERRRWMRRQGMFDPAQLVFIDESWTNTSMVRLRGRCPPGERLIGYAPVGHWIGCEGKVCLTRHNWCSSTKAGRIPAWCGCAAAVRAASG